MREVLVGDLAYVQLATVLQIMENEQLSGWVQTRAGTVVIRGGLVVDVDVDGLPIADAMMRLVDQEQGGFIVEAGTPPMQSPIATVPALLMQAARLKDEWQRSRDLVLRVGQATPPAGLERLLPLLDGRRTLEQAVQEAGVFVSEVIDLVHDALQARGLVHAHGVNDRPQAGQNLEDRPPLPDLVKVGHDD